MASSGPRGSEIVPRLMRGLGYLAKGPAQGVPSYLASLAARGEPFLWITDRRDPETPAGGTSLPVTTLPGLAGSLDPKRVQDLRGAVMAFLDEHEGGTVVVDCMDVLTLHNGVERVVRALEDLHEEIALRGAILLVFLDPRRANPRLVAWLEREFDPVPGCSPTEEAAQRLLS